VVNHAVSGSQYITISAQPTDSNVTGAKFNTAFTGDVTYTLASGVTGGTAAKATGYVQGITANVAANFFLLTAENNGAWGDGLTVEIAGGLEGATATSYGTFTMIVKLDGAEKERWTEISIDTTHNRNVESLVNNYSDYLRVSALVAPTKSTTTKVTDGTYTIIGGSDGTAVVSGDYTTNIAYLDQVTGDLLINLPGVSASSEVNAAISYAANRGTGFVIIDADTTKTTAAEALAVVAPYTNSGYAAVYYPGATVADPTKTGPAALRTSPLGGAVMAIYGKTERMYSVAKAPAGFNLDLANVFGLVANYTEADEGTLYDANINPIRLVPGTGAIINGTRTLAVTSPSKYIPIRRTLNFVKARIKEISSFAVFEPNDANLRQKVITVIQQELRSLWAKGGLKGANESQAFYVTCNASNNTVSTIGNGELHVEVGLALQYPAEYIIVNVSQWTGGANAVETL
jgi:phage tail sheath protein FI